MVYALGMKTILKRYGRVLAFVAVVLALGAAWLWESKYNMETADEEHKMTMTELSSNATAAKARLIRTTEAIKAGK
jgi:hypothetical protein